MNSKSKSWAHIRDSKIKCRIQYTKSDLEFVNSGKRFDSVPTVVVTLWNGEDRYVGVAQCGPKELNRPEKGREIAAGRALKAMLRHIEDPSLSPVDVQSNGSKEVNLFGNIPDTILVLDDKLLFDSAEA